ncbi:accessory Sec system translocase SecA2 [Fructilactobacillus carniphilus]|uniref:Protein translocase subunit SecA n=1 Tax=Fructilactobacillus carniphilus TaxID=2940297 RepID=A0ABY5BY45_9LACO|nr:accessory Sec system translocase SecA2 [Fructilactobacillus carniphilus]USS90031.1 accessory Sec system translocase SecA2 [Fructilactobacillus carniphilus]
MHKYRKLAKKIKQRAQELQTMTDQELKRQTTELRDQLKNGKSLDDILIESYATVCEADRRILGLTPYLTQIIGALVLHEGNIAEMKTGEGKTLTATMPLYLHGLIGNGVFLITANPYLARRDAEEIGKVYRWLGLTVGLGVPNDDEEDDDERELDQIYASDIVYTTHSSLGFDYLFDNLATTPDKQHIKRLNYAIIDEIDSILLDQAQTPLIVSGAPNVKSNLYELSELMIHQLKEGIDFKTATDAKSVWLTPAGISHLEEFAGIKDLLSEKHHNLYRHLVLALKANYLFTKDRDYVVEAQTVVLLDKMNGRKLPGTKLQAGLHQAIEAKEGVKLSDETKGMASITYQNLFKLFTRISGMTGTALTDADEFRDTYHLNTIVIPTNQKVIRKDHPDQVYVTNQAKIEASLAKLEEITQQNRPVLIETGSVSMSELYSRLLLAKGYAHNVLNATSAAKENRIIKEAGNVDSITVATAMAGRGTDIKLSNDAKKNGGLYVIGTERMSSARIDNQLRGRSGRQGEPGDSMFFVSLEDKIVTENAPKWVKKFRKQCISNPNFDINQPLTELRIKHVVDRAQSVQKNSEVSGRRQTLAFDEVAKVQRNYLYQLRNKIMRSADLDQLMITAIRTVISNFVSYVHSYTEVMDFIYNNIDYFFVDEKQILEQSWENPSFLTEFLLKLIKQQEQKVFKQFSSDDQLLYYKRLVLLKSIDLMWIEQVDALQQLKEVVSNRNWGQHKPVYEYQTEAQRSFEAMKNEIYLLILKNTLLSEIVYQDDGTIKLVFV